jgi:hypothetical protein
MYLQLPRFPSVPMDWDGACADNGPHTLAIKHYDRAVKLALHVDREFVGQLKEDH